MLTRAVLMLSLAQGGVLAEQPAPRANLAQDDGTAASTVQDAMDQTPVPLPAPDPSVPLPRCTALPDDIAGMANCTLDNAGVSLTFLYEGTTAEARLTITQTAPEGGERIVSDPIRVTGVTFAPHLTDIDDNGISELFLPLGRNGNQTIFDIWLPDETYFFARVDEIAAPSAGAIAARDGLLVLTIPDARNDTLFTETAMLLDPTGFTRLYSLAVDTAAGTCTLLGNGNGIAVNGALIEADCADRHGFPAPGAAERPTPDVMTQTPSPDVSPKSL